MSEDERQLLASWDTNAAAWTEAVRAGRIASRERVTNRAILDAITARVPERVLDLGCGEGWLVRALAQRGIAAIGIDASAGLIEAARADGGEFACLSYAQLGDARAVVGEVDLAVANFALLGEVLEPCLRDVAKLLVGQRRLLIQTLHPLGVEPPYEAGWRRETFAGFGREGHNENEWAPMPWYFRPFGAWVELLAAAGFVLERVIEPNDAHARPDSRRPLSLILDASVA